ncbi:MAG: FtsX-like permease family protein [Roseivirga sp.]|nr:FtsX-like permease family protein [Roseivirga sp.]
MFTNYLKLALRRLQREKLFTVLNVTGLTVGIAAFILLFVYVRHELSYDKFHSQLDRTHVIGWNMNARDGLTHSEGFSIKGARLMMDRIPEIELMTQVSGLMEERLITIGELAYYEGGLLLTDDNFLKIFDFEILQGTDRLGEPATAMITSELARKYFNERNPIGELMKIDGEGEFEITAVITEPPTNSHLQFDIILSNLNRLKRGVDNPKEQYPWGQFASNYVLLSDGADPGLIQQKIDELSAAEFPGHLTRKNEEGITVSSNYLLPFADIHLKSGFSRALSPVSDILYVYIFSSIGVLILFIACFNYINLITARSMRKAKEIGLRKVIGARRQEIIVQQIVEAGLFTFISVMLAFALSERSLPYFNNLIGTELQLSYWSLDFVVLISGLTVTVAFIAGYYPAFKLSKFLPVSVLRGGGTPKGKSGMRRGLVFFQFFITQVLIICTFIIQSQLSYLQNKSLGYNREQTLFIETHAELKNRGEVFKAGLERLPGVQSVSMSESMFDWNAIVFIPFQSLEGFEDSKPNDIFVPSVFNVDGSFVETMGMTTVAGKAFHELENPETSHIMINETAAKQLGWDEPLGKEMTIWEEKRTVVGVIRDFHDESLKVVVKPAILTFAENPTAFVNIRLNASNISETMHAIEAEWDALVSDRPFSYQFYDAFYDAQYKKEGRLGNIFNAFSIIAISISILGLIGLTTFSAQQRLKEFGVRKVLGARVIQLMTLLSKEFVWLLVISFVLAAPITYYFMSDWLTEFVYRIDIGVAVYLLAVLATLMICMLTVGLQSYKVSRFNPAEVLRSE